MRMNRWNDLLMRRSGSHGAGASPAVGSPEAKLDCSLPGRSSRGGDETPSHAASPPAMPVRPTPPRGRRAPSLPRFTGGPWAPPPPPPSSSPPPRKEGEDARRELERKAAEAEARLRRKEAENAALRREIESYHVRWLEHEIKIKSLEESFHEKMASLQVAREASAVRRAAASAAAHDRRRGSSDDEPARAKKTPEAEASATARLPRGRSRHHASGGGRRRRNEAALAEPWHPGVPGGNSAGDLERLESRFRAWEKDHKARLRAVKSEIDSDKRSSRVCWI